MKFIKENILYIIFYLKNFTKFNRKSFYLFDVPSRGNLGDQAIAYAENEFLKSINKNNRVIEVHSYFIDRERLFNKIINKISEENVIFLTGGGSLDDRAYKVTNRFCTIIKTLKNNKIIMFPQTIDYSDSKLGNDLEKMTIDVFNSHDNLILSAREMKSYEKMKKNYPNNKVILTPDIVLFLDKTKICNRNDKILFLMRKDQEKKLSYIEQDKIESFFINKGLKIEKKDTYIFSKINKNKGKYIWNKNFELKKIFNKCSKSKLIVTDRLHGMIFATITSTPAIIFSNTNHKVKGVYKWLENLEYIHYVDNINDLPKAFDEIEKRNFNKYDNKKIREEFKKIEKEI